MDTVDDFNNVNRLIAEKKYRNAMNLLTTISNDTPALHDLFKFKIMVQWGKKIEEKLLKRYFDSFEIDEKIPTPILENFYSIAGDYYFKHGQYGQAINQYEKCLENNIVNTHAIIGKAKSYQCLGINDKSEENYLQIAHLYDWNRDNLVENLKIDVNYSNFKEIIENNTFSFLPNSILIDIGILYYSINKTYAEKIFTHIEKNPENHNNQDPSYFFVEFDPYPKFKTEAENNKDEILKRDIFIEKISQYFPEFYKKYISKIKNAKYNNDKIQLTVNPNNSNSKQFEIKSKAYQKKWLVYSIIPKQIEINEETTAAFFLYLIDPNIKSLEKLLEMIKLNVIHSDKLELHELLEIWLNHIGDDLSLFLLRKEQNKKRSEKNTIRLLVKSKQSIKEINQNNNDVYDIIEKIKNNQTTTNIFVDSLKDYFKLNNKEKNRLPLDRLNLKNILNEITKNVEVIKKRNESKLQDTKSFNKFDKKIRNLENKMKKLETLRSKLKKMEQII